MEYEVTQEIMYCPLSPVTLYFVFSDESEEPSMKTLELIDKQKNAFGDMIYYIRDEKGTTATVFEQDVEDYLKIKGASSLMKGQSYIYRK